jgi:hypothetical protein
VLLIDNVTPMRSSSLFPRGDIWLDDLDLQDAVLGGGLALVPGAELTLYTVAHGRARVFGRFSGPADALAALDELG